MGHQLQRDLDPDAGRLVAEGPEFAREVVERPRLGARIDHVADDLDVPGAEGARALEEVAPDDIRLGAAFSCRIPVGQAFELDAGQLIVGENLLHRGNADTLPDRGIVLMNQSHPAEAGALRSLDARLEIDRAHLRRDPGDGVTGKRPVGGVDLDILRHSRVLLRSIFEGPAPAGRLGGAHRPAHARDRTERRRFLSESR